MRQFQVTHRRSMWGIAGFSSGGYIAANLALRHRLGYGAAGIMDGYFRPQDGEAAGVIGADPAALDANDPLLAASRLAPGVGPLPSFWVGAGTADAADIHAARDFVATLRHSEAVPFEVEPHAHHNFYAWQAALPHLLAWAWQQVASPGLRVSFPTTGVSPNSTVHVPGHPRRRPTIPAHTRRQAARHPVARKRTAANS
jgi:pimeloyl-ACP methyl ester carboxylesterase